MFFFVVFLILLLSLSLKIDCLQHADSPTFHILKPNNTEGIKKVKENQFHITEKGEITIECFSTFPIKIIFTGIMPNEIQHTTMEWDRDTKRFRVSIVFQNTPQATGPYSCINTDEIATNTTFKSTIYIFADDGRSKLFLLYWKKSGTESGIRSTSMISRERILLPCLTFRANIEPKLYYYDKSLGSMNPPVVPKTKYDYDPSEGFLVNITKNKYSMFECSLDQSVDGIKFQIPDVNYKTNLPEVKNEDDVIYWASTSKIHVECEGIFPLEVRIDGFKKNSHKLTSQKPSSKRNNFYYGHVASTDFDQALVKEPYNVTITCQKLKGPIFHKWTIIFGKPARLKQAKIIKFDRLKKLFYCSDSSDMTPTMTVINCHNLVNCESARRFDPLTSRLQSNYPYSYNTSNSMADRYLKQELNIEQDEDCAILNQNPAIKLGIVYCLLVKKSQGENSLVSLQYFVDLNDQIVEDMHYKYVADVLRMPEIRNTTSVYRGEFINFTCEASIFVFAKGLELEIVFKNGSTSTSPYPRQAIESHDSYKITLNETVCIWSSDISLIGCRALKWRDKQWEKVFQKIKVKESKVPTIFAEDFDNNLTVIDINMTSLYPYDGLDKNITCKATGIPQPTITWTKLNGKKSKTNVPQIVNSRDEFKDGYVTSTLVFADVSTRDANYVYACIARNAAGVANITFNITVTGNKHYEPDKHWIYSFIGIGVFSLVVFILLVTVCILCRTLKSKQTQIEKLSEVEILHFMKGNMDLVDKYKELHEVAQYLPYKQQYEIHSSKIEIKNDVLGTGDYGMVLKGILERSGKKIPVAVKTVKSATDIHHLRSLLSEIKIMMYIGKNPYIIEMLGAMTKNIREGKLYVAIEFCSNGSLQSYLRSCRPVFQDQIVDDEIKAAERTRIKKSPRRFLGFEEAITNVMEKRRSRNSHQPAPVQTTTLINWCYQIARGMEYLSTKKVIHGDLATRNILITDSLSVKITDFGLSRYLYEYSNYVTKEKSDPVPWRWLSIEAIQDSKFSTQSDVWAYGVTLWEIFSLGETPYQGFCWGEEFVQDLNKGYRMGKPQYATLDIHNTMLECWNKAPGDRPSFQDISNNLQELLERVGVFVDYVEPIKAENVTTGSQIPEIFVSEEV